MDVRAQVSMVFHLDKCIGCHTCSIACKNIWTDRKGAEYMWWNNVETKPGTGYPTLWEDQNKYKGGWVLKNGEPRLRATDKLRGFANIFFNPYLPSLDDYYEPWTYRYEDLFDAPEGDDQPTARPISLVTGQPVNIDAGPNWDDDLSGSPVYAENDINLEGLSAQEKEQLFELERIMFFYLPRICNHCLNPGCIGACPAGAVYKRGEDGIVLISQEKCRGWRFCISGCPYKKAYYNWNAGKSEKCILCFPRLESGWPPACFHSCVGRIRYLGVVLYDADQIHDTLKTRDEDLVEAHRRIILDPFDPNVIAAARQNGIADDWIESAQKSPVYKFVKVWQIAFPLHIEFRTLPMLFYVPPLTPVVANVKGGNFDVVQDDILNSIDNARAPIRYLANMFSAGNEEVLKRGLRKMYAVRYYMRLKTVGDVSEAMVTQMLRSANMTAEEAEDIYRMTTIPTFQERFIIPPYTREYTAELFEHPYDYKARTGFGVRKSFTRRGA